MREKHHGDCEIYSVRGRTYWNCVPGCVFNTAGALNHSSYLVAVMQERIAELEQRPSWADVREWFANISIECPNCHGRPDEMLKGHCWTCNDRALLGIDEIIRDMQQKREKE